MFISARLLLLWLVGQLLMFAVDARTLPETIERVRPSIVGVGTLTPSASPPWHFVGTGFAVAAGRHVITNAHTVDVRLQKTKLEELAVLVQGPRPSVRSARVLDSDPAHDVALLAIDGPPLPALRLGHSARVREGELYAFTGFPIGFVLGAHPVTHRGIVSAITPIAIPQRSARSLDRGIIKRLREPYDVFQLDATAYPGNSGSPLYAPDSALVVGVINKVFVKQSKENLLKDPSGITYAIPIAHARALLERHGLAP